MSGSGILNDKIDKLEFLAEASRMLNETLDRERLLGIIVKIVKNALNAQAVLLSVVDTEDKSLVFELARGRHDRAVRGMRIPFGEGLMGWVAVQEKPLIINDARGYKRVSLDIEEKLRLRPRSIMAIPLKRRGKLIGVLEAINQKSRGSFSEEDMSLAITLGGHIAVAVANTRLYEKAQRVGLEYSLLAGISADMGKSLSLDEVLKRIITNLKKLVPFDAAAVFVFDRRKQLLVSKLHEGYPKGVSERMDLKRDEGVVSLAVKSMKGIIVDDVSKSGVYVNARNSTRSEIVAPMLSGGRVVGAFNLESNRLGAYRADHLRLLEAFAGQASVAVERAHLYEEQKEKQEIEKELRVARTVQEFFTPRKSRAVGPFRIAGVNHPSLEVSGDYYDFFPLKGSMMAFAIADVAGKGVPASIIMAGFRAALHTVAPYLTTARQIAVRANEILLETVRPEDFVTVFIGVLDQKNGVITYCNAGHNPPILMKPDGRHRLLESGGPVLGVLEDIPIVEERFMLKDETLFCYTDGATEATNAADEEYGEQRLISALRKAVDLPPRQLCRALYADLKEFLGDSAQGDDVTYLVLKRRK